MCTEWIPNDISSTKIRYAIPQQTVLLQSVLYAKAEFETWGEREVLDSRQSQRLHQGTQTVSGLIIFSTHFILIAFLKTDNLASHVRSSPPTSFAHLSLSCEEMLWL